MATLAPMLQTDIQPIQARDASANATSGVLGAISGLFPTRAAPTGPSMDDTKKQDKVTFFSALDDARQAREAGDTAAADRLARDATRAFVRKYGTSEDDVNSAYQDFSGVPINVSLDPEGSAITDTQLMAKPEYQSAVFLAEKNNPNASAEQVHQIAIGSIKAKEANDFMIKQIQQQEEVNWYDVEKVYVDKAVILGNQFRSMIAAMDKDSIIMPEEAKALRKAYQDSIGGLQKPAGVSTTKWKEYEENYISDLTSLVDTAVGLGADKGIDTDTSRALDRMIAIAVSTGKLNPMIQTKFQGSSGHWEDVQAIVGAMKQDPKFEEAYNTLITGTMDDLFNLVTDFENKTPDQLDKVNVEPFKALDPEDQRKEILANASALGTGDGTPGVLAVDVNDVIKKTELLGDQALQPEDLSRIYSPSFFKSINAINEVNPAIGQDLSMKAIGALDKQLVRSQKAFVSEGVQRGVVISGGDIVPDLKNPYSKKADDYVKRYFGGSWDRAIAAKGLPEGVPQGRQLVAMGYQNFLDVSDSMSYMKTRTAKFSAISKQLEVLKKNLPLEGQEEPVAAGGGGGGSESTSESIGAKLGLDFETLEAENGLPAGFLERTAYLESRGNPKAKNPDSSAGGLFQQTNGNAKQYGVKDKFDPVQSTDGAVDFAVDNTRILTKALGRKPTGAELYLAHQQGGTGAARLLANPTAMASDVVGADAVRLNGGDVSMTAGEFANLWLDKYNNAPTVNTTTGTPANANSVAANAGPAGQRAVGNTNVAPTGIEFTGGSIQTPETVAPTAEMPQEAPKETPVEGRAPVGEVAVTDAGKALLQALGGSADREFNTVEEMNAATDLSPGEVVQVGGEVYVVRKDGTKQKVGG